ncbi:MULTISPECIES: group II intron maturase-specific domain-containing protein [Marinobacter]|uniref:Reverse transcriptase domain-containing protein n=1 Tax=Marinobacter metalliresistant TaxID=2961995 RepID=A0ABZ2W2Z3_9GAMM|nr:group II intron maturase-specific domain-containing protein [Marinobacter sp. Arc7-DN-1]
MDLERRGHRFVRYADDCNIYVKSQRSGQRVLASLTDYLRRRLKLTVNEEKSAVGRSWEQVFPGFTFTRRGRAMQTVIDELAVYLRGWKGYYGFAQVKSPIQNLEKWVRRKLRCYHLKQWGRSGYRQLRKRGVSVRKEGIRVWGYLRPGVRSECVGT